MSDNRAEEFNRKKLAESERIDRIHKDTVHLLQTEERFVNFFKNYDAKSIESFIKFYASQKAHWYQYGDALHNVKKMRNEQWRKPAVEMLKHIFVKKLFNLKCRWVAGEMDLPGVEVSADFDRWETNPELCAQIEPISHKELECYLHYLDTVTEEEEEKDLHENGSPESALDFYHGHKSHIVEGYQKLIPSWYHHYDAHFGTAPLMNLGLIRTDMEQDYHDLWSEHIYKKTLSEEQLKTWAHLSRLQRKELKENPEKEKAYREERNRVWAEAEKGKPKYFSLSIYDRVRMKEVVTMIEPEEVRDLYDICREWKDRGEQTEEIDGDLIHLENAKEYIPIESHDDYREAIKEAYQDYERKMHREMLPVLFEEYCETVAAHQPFNWKSHSSSAAHDSGELIQRLLAARKWKGEPENLDFLKKENLPKDHKP